MNSTYRTFFLLRLHLAPASGVTRGRKGDIRPRAQHIGDAKLRSKCYMIITKCEMSVDADNYDLQNVECQRQRLLPSTER